MRHKSLIQLVVIQLILVLSFSATVILKNGQTITGRLTTQKENYLIIQTVDDFKKISREEIQSVNFDPREKPSPPKSKVPQTSGVANLAKDLAPMLHRSFSTYLLFSIDSGRGQDISMHGTTSTGEAIIVNRHLNTNLGVGMLLDHNSSLELVMRLANRDTDVNLSNGEGYFRSIALGLTYLFYLTKFSHTDLLGLTSLNSVYLGLGLDYYMNPHLRREIPNIVDDARYENAIGYRALVGIHYQYENFLGFKPFLMTVELAYVFATQFQINTLTENGTTFSSSTIAQSNFSDWATIDGSAFLATLGFGVPL